MAAPASNALTSDFMDAPLFGAEDGADTGLRAGYEALVKLM
jgi:hypothetical protein